AERREAEKREAARREEQKKHDAEMANAATPPPPPPQIGYMSPMFVGLWESKPDTTHEGRRLEIKGDSSYVLSGGETNSGVVNASAGFIHFSSKASNQTISGSYKMQSLGKMVIEASIANGERMRVRTSPTPVRQ